jgi:hypothetical protein
MFVVNSLSFRSFLKALTISQIIIPLESAPANYPTGISYLSQAGT